MISVLKFIWQLPQNIIALIIIGLNKLFRKSVYTKSFDGIKVHFVEIGVFKCGVSLGNYIILHKSYDTYYSQGNLEITVKHEHGHQIQSLYFGWLYLFVIGIPSVINNITSRIYKKSSRWYYNRYPEKWADKLGNVTRTYF